MTTPKTRRPQARQPGRAGGRPRGAGPGRPGRGGRPLPRGEAMYTPGASAARRMVERTSAQALVFLHRLPTWLPPLALAALLVAGLAAGGWLGSAALVLVAAFLSWLAYVSWPGLTPRGRLLRAASIAVLAALAVVQARR